MTKLASAYIKYLANVKHRADKTIQNYELYLRRFLEFIKKQQIKSMEQVDEEQIHKYELYLRKQKFNAKTQNYHLIALRGFLRYLQIKKINCICSTRVNLIKIEKKPIEYAGIKDLADLLEAPLRIMACRIIQARDKAILEVLMCTGLRVSEMAVLRKSQVDFKKNYIVFTKGKHERVLFLSNQAKHWIEKYLKLRKDKLPYLFIGHDKAMQNRVKKEIQKGLSSRSIERIVKKYAQLAGIEKHVSPHTLRQNYVKKLLMQGKSIENIQKKLGNVSANFIDIYIQ